MNRIAQKKREKRVLLRVKEIWSDFPDGKTIDSDPPDFIVLNHGKKIGVELTTYYQDRDCNGILMVEQEGLREKLCNLVVNNLANSRVKPIHISLQFRNILLNRQELPTLVADIISVVEEYDKRVPTAEVLSIDLSPPSPIRIVGLMRFEKISKHACKSVNSGWVPSITSSDIQSEIRRKNNKVPQDKYGCDELILVVEVRGGKLSSYSKLDSSIQEDTFEATYDKCILFYDDRIVFELALA